MVWLTVQQVGDLYADAETKRGRREQVRNWVRRGRVEWRRQHGEVQVNAETVETYLKERGSNGVRVRDAA